MTNLNRHNQTKVHYLYETNFGLIRKFFSLDKNYILEQVQFHSRQHLLHSLYHLAAQNWATAQNPLGLQDGFSMKVIHFNPESYDGLFDFYELISAVYRFQHGSNQLEFIWDGTDTAERYAREWRASYTSWVTGYCKDPLFVQAVLDLTVFRSPDRDVRLADLRMQRFLLLRFDLRYSPSKGLAAAMA